MTAAMFQLYPPPSLLVQSPGVVALGYLGGVVGGGDPMYAALADGVRAHADVLMEVVEVRELRRACVHLEDQGSSASVPQKIDRLI